jgi:hypothetical protein
MPTPSVPPMKPIMLPWVTNTTTISRSLAPSVFRSAICRAFSMTVMINVPTIENDATMMMIARIMNIAIFSSLSAENRLRLSSRQPWT